MDVTAGSLEDKESAGSSPSELARRWKLELKLADKREAAWRKKGGEIYKIYTPESAAANSFNILWTNTETLRQACYNSLPQPQVRRRYSDADPIGKAVGEVLTRSLEFSQETYDFDAVIKGDVLAMLLPGRAVSRVRYVPDFKQLQVDESQESEAYEEIDWEQVICERVQWDDLRFGAGKTWDEVPWVAFRHVFTREDNVEKFGDDIGNKVPLDSVDDEDVKTSKDKGDLFKTAEVWEIWDKDEKKVHWLCKTYATILKSQDDPMGLQGFYPIPRPLYAIENDQTLVPASLYGQYEQQAKELNRISTRINKIIEALKVRGVYDATLTELSELMKGSDNDLIAAQNVTALLERGGLDKAIWMMPIDTAAMVLKELYAQRESTKQVIYEITGISDILRAASDPSETFGAQKIKATWGSQRLQRMQKEVQRYIRDLIRLKAEVIAEKFQTATLEQMTLLEYPHEQQVQQQYIQQVMQWQQAAMQAQQQGQQPPPQPQQPQGVVTWEAISQALHDDATRSYRVEIETDSTLSATQDADIEGIVSVMGAVTAMSEKLMPAVQQGLLPLGAVKEILLSVVRRAKMGTAVEDAIDKLQQPPPPQDPEAGKAQAAMQLEQMKAQMSDQQHQRQLAADAQAEKFKADLQMQLQAHEQAVQAQQNEHQNQLEATRAQQQAVIDAQLEQQRMAGDERIAGLENNMKLLTAQLQRQTALEVAEINAQTTLDSAQISAAKQGSE